MTTQNRRTMQFTIMTVTNCKPFEADAGNFSLHWKPSADILISKKLLLLNHFCST